MRTRAFVPALALLVAVAGAQTATAKEQYSYSAKFVCGYNPSNQGTNADGTKVEGEPSVKFGNYATEINLVWPELYLTSEQNNVFKHLVLLVDRGKPVGREPNVAAARKYADSIILPSMGGTMDDCNRIAELLWGAVPTPYPLTIGYLVIQSTHELDVTAVYTAQVCSNWAASPQLGCLDSTGKQTGMGISIDVERVPTRKLIIP